MFVTSFLRIINIGVIIKKYFYEILTDKKNFGKLKKNLKKRKVLAPELEKMLKEKIMYEFKNNYRNVIMSSAKNILKNIVN